MKWVLRFVKNKYIITITAFVVWVLFFDKNDVFSQVDLTKQVNKMVRDTVYYSQEIQQNRMNGKALLDNPQALEKFARENYLMKRDSEDVFIFVNDTVK